MAKIKTEFIDNFLVVWDHQKGSELYKLGFYGKPIGIPKPKATDFHVPLILDLMEGVLGDEESRQLKLNFNKRMIENNNTIIMN